MTVRNDLPHDSPMLNRLSHLCAVKQKFARASVETKIQNCVKGIYSLMSYQCLAALFECYFFRQVSKYSHIMSYIRQAKVGFTMPIEC